MKWHNVVGLMPEFSPSQMSLGKSATSVCLRAPFGKMLVFLVAWELLPALGVKYFRKS